MKKLIICLVATIVISWSTLAFAEIAVIVHPSSEVKSLTQDEISRIFLGKTKSFPNGAQAIPVNQDEGLNPWEKFNEVVCNKSPSQYKAYWSRLVFTGKGTPPKEAGNDADIKALIAANPKMIGYVDARAVDNTVKVVFRAP